MLAAGLAVLAHLAPPCAQAQAAGPAQPPAVVLDQATGRGARTPAAQVQARLTHLDSLAGRPALDTSATGRAFAYRQQRRWVAQLWQLPPGPAAADASQWVALLRHTYAYDAEAWLAPVAPDGRLGPWRRLSSGDHTVPPTRHEMVWAFEAPPGARVLLLYHGAGYYGGPALRSQDHYRADFLRAELLPQALLYIALAFGAFFLFYNGVLFVMVRQQAFVHYMIYVLGTSSYLWFASHVAGAWWAERVALGGYNYLFALLLSLGMFGYAQYSRAFVETARVAPGADWLFRGSAVLTGLLLANALLNVWLMAAQLNVLFNLLLGANLLLIVAASLWAGQAALRHRLPAAWPYVLASTCPVAASAVAASVLLTGRGVADLKGIFPYIYLAFIFEYLLLSMALGARIRHSEQARQQAQAETIAALESNQQLIAAQNAELERRVSARTHELGESNRQLTHTLEALRRTQAQLIAHARQAALARVLAALAHQMNTPLGVCVTAASNLAERTQHVVAATTSGTLTRTELEHFATTADALAQSLVANLQRVSRLVHDTDQASAAAAEPAPQPDAAPVG